MELLTERQDGSDVTGGGSAGLWWSSDSPRSQGCKRALGNGEMGGWGASLGYMLSLVPPGRHL